MKLVNPNFICQIEIRENEIPVLVIENPDLFAKTIGEMRWQLQGEPGNWVLSENLKEMTFSKSIDVVIDPFQTDLNQKRILTHLYSNIEKRVLDTEQYMDWNDLFSQMIRITEDQIGNVSFSLKYRSEYAVKEFLKNMDVKFVEQPENLLERLIDYVCVCSEILGIKLFVFVNLKSYLDTKSLEMLYQKLFYEKIFVLLIEGKEAEKYSKFEKVNIIDQDYCLIERT